MKDKIEVPCENCVLIAMCRYKKFERIANECKLLLDSLYFDDETKSGSRSKFFSAKITKIRDILQPEEWTLIKDDTDRNFIHIVDRRPEEYIVTEGSTLQDNGGN